MRPPLIVAAIALLVGAGSAAARPTAARSPETAQSVRVVRQMPTLEERVLAAINDVRHERGLPMLRLNPSLAATARQHSLSMAQQGFFSHSSVGGSGFWSRVEGKYGGPRWRVGENLVWASPHLSAPQAVEMWLNSPPHRANLLAPIWREVGLGAVHSDSAPGVYRGLAATILTADFGVRG